MNKSPLVSVICITMNHEKFIERSFTNLVNQTFKDFEIIYLDNNSTDSSFEIADKIFRESGIEYRGFKRDKNIGISENVNFLISKVRCKYITPLSGDDFWELNNLEEKVKYYEAHPEIGMLYGSGYKFFYDTGKKELIEDKFYKEGWILKDLLKRNFINAVGFMSKKSVFDDVGLFDEKCLLEDWDMWLRISEKYPIGYLNKPLVYYGRTSNNVSSDINFMDKGLDYIITKYSKYKEIKQAKKKSKLYHAYEYATKAPSIKSLGFIINNFQFNFTYFKQFIKCLIGIIKMKSSNTSMLKIIISLI